MTSETFVKKAQPLGGDDDLIGTALKNFVVNSDERHDETFRQFLIREATFGGLEFTSGA